MWSRVEVKERGRAALKANYWRSVLCSFILMLLLGGTTSGMSSVRKQVDDQPNDQQNVQEYEQVYHEQNDQDKMGQLAQDSNKRSGQNKNSLIAQGNQAQSAQDYKGQYMLASVGMKSNQQYDMVRVSRRLDGLNPMGAGNPALIAAMLIALLSAITIFLFMFLLLKILVFNPLQVGCYAFFRDNVDYGDAKLDLLKSGFSHYGQSVTTLLLKDVFLGLWTCLFIIPGIVKAYSYRMVPFIVRDHPELSPTEAITLSRDLMRGNKWRTFVFDLSFIGWAILGLFTMNLVNIFWTEPYRQNANAALYLELCQNG